MSEGPERLLADEFLCDQSIRVFHGVYHRVPLHWHEFFELSLICAGEGLHHINGRSFRVGPQTMFLLSPADFHELVPQPGDRFTILNVIFAEANLSEEIRHLLASVTLPQATVLSDSVRDRVVLGYRQIEEEQQRREWGHLAMVISTLQSLLVRFLREATPVQGELPNAQNPFSGSIAGMPDVIGRASLIPSMALALNYIHHHFREPLRLADVARQAGLSPAYFSQQFHRLAGVTFQDYVQSLRVCLAVHLLETTRLSVAEIGFASGFQSSSHFSRVFRQKVGHSPLTVRDPSPLPTVLMPHVTNGPATP